MLETNEKEIERLRSETFTSFFESLFEFLLEKDIESAKIVFKRIISFSADCLDDLFSKEHQQQIKKAVTLLKGIKNNQDLTKANIKSYLEKDKNLF